MPTTLDIRARPRTSWDRSAGFTRHHGGPQEMVALRRASGVLYQPVDHLGGPLLARQFHGDAAEPGPEEPAEHQVAGTDDGRVAGYDEAGVLEGARQQHRVLVVVGEHGVQAERPPA